MRFLARIVLMALTIASASAQKTKAEEDLELLRDLLADPGWAGRISVREIIEDVRAKGIGFDLGKQELGVLIRAGAAGNRDPGEVAELILAGLAACEPCRSRSVLPMGKDEIKTLTEWKFSEEAILRQARARGVKDIEPTASGVAGLRAVGASDALIRLLIPDDRLVAPPVSGYQALALKRAEEYDRSAERGWLKVSATFPADGYHEFIFRHNSLFHKPIDPVSSDDLAQITAYFNQPAPRSAPSGLVDFKVELDPPIQPPPPPDKRKQSKNAPAQRVEMPPTLQVFYEPQSPGAFNQFRITVHSHATSARSYTFKLSWQTLKTPKAAPPTPPTSRAK